MGDDVDDVAGLSGRGRFPGNKKGEDDDEEGGGGRGGEGRILRPRGVVVRRRAADALALHGGRGVHHGVVVVVGWCGGSRRF